MEYKKLVAPLFILLFSFTFGNGCKKDYPDDIPKWLKNYIEDCKRGRRDCCTRNGDPDFGGSWISEWKNGDGKILYSISSRYNFPGPRTNILFYDNAGNVLCERCIGDYAYCGFNHTCDTMLNIYSYKETRYIWNKREKSGPDCR